MSFFQALHATIFGHNLARNLRWLRLSKRRMLRQVLPSKSFVVQVCSAGGLAVTSDIICQKLVEKKEKYDIHRILRFGLVTATLIAPTQFLWFRFLSNKLVPSGGRKLFNTGIRRMLFDQTICAPILTSMFIFSLSALESLNIGNSIEYTRKIFTPIMITNYKVWPLVQLINMSIIPLHFRVIFVQFVAMFWNMYISHMAHNH